MKRLLISIVLGSLSISSFALDVVFRYDDFRLIDDSVQNALIEMFNDEKVPLCIAVIPCTGAMQYIIENGYALQRIKDIHNAGYLSFALHGCNHQGETINGEFLALSNEEQLFRLTRGSQFLDSVFDEHVHIFIPPWNRYNTITQNVLADLGYNIISADIADSRYISDKRFQYYPEGIDHPQKLHRLIEKNANRDGLVVCMFHRYDFSHDYTLKDLRRTIRFCKNAEGIRITSFDALAAETNDFNEERILCNLVHPLLSKVLYTRPIILSHREVIRIRVCDLLLHLLLFVFLAGILGWFGWMNTLSYYVLQTFVCIFSCVLVWQQWLSPKAAVAVGCTTVLLIGIASIIIKRNFKITNK